MRQSMPPAGRAEKNDAVAVAPPIVHEVLAQSGEPLSESVLVPMQASLGHDLRRVRVHADDRAADSAEAVGAVAYTVGRHVVFGAGQFAPGHRQGQQLLRHELLHTIQQGQSSAPAGPIALGPVRHPFEEAAYLGDAGAVRAENPLLRRQARPGPSASQIPDTPTRPADPLTDLGPVTTATLDAFATASENLTSAHLAALARIEADLNARPLPVGGFITLIGYADRRGDAGENRALGQRRANAVLDYLRSRLTDETTKREIRAHSVGAPSDGPAGDVPSLRKVDIIIVRRNYDRRWGADRPGDRHQPAPSAPPSKQEPTATPVADEYGPPEKPEADIRKPVLPGRGPRREQVPPGFWEQVRARPPEPDAIPEISRRVNQSLGTDKLADVAAGIANKFHVNRADAKRAVNEAFQHGGEAAVKRLLNELVEYAAAQLRSSQPTNPVSEALQPKPFPDVPGLKFKF